MRLTAKQVTWMKVCLHLAGLLPFLWLVWAINHGGLASRSSERYSAFYWSHCTEILLATLLITPLARYAKQPLLIRTRRLLGLWCFAWATLHLTSYALLELGVNNLALLGKELITRPYLTLGIISWVILLALAFTSTQAMQRKLGKHWQQLHNFVYLVAILAPIHYLWSVKIISPQPLIYAGLAVLLLALRYKKLLSLFNRLRKAGSQQIISITSYCRQSTRYPCRMRRERPIRPTQITSSYVSFVINLKSST